jgi:hypothetical protein
MAEFPKKTGEVYFRDEAGALWRCESYEDENGVVNTQQTEIEPAPPPAIPE